MRLPTLLLILVTTLAPLGAVAEPNRLPLVDGFQFVDIGAGVPDPGLDLAGRPSASFVLQKAS